MSTFTKAFIVVLFASAAGPAPAPPVIETETRQVAASRRSGFEIGIEVVTATPEQRERLDKAPAFFAESGLELPAVRVHFDDTTDECNGHAGLYHRTNRDASGPAHSVQICDGQLFTVIHEPAHAWTYHALDEDRRASLVETWGLETWGDHDVEWAERAAQAVTAGPIIGFPTDNPGILSKVCNFELVTGKRLPDPSLFDCTTV